MKNKILILLFLFISSIVFSQEIKYQLYVRDVCNDTIEKAIFYSLKNANKIYEIKNLDSTFIKVPIDKKYELISEETNERLIIEITQLDNKDTLLLPAVNEYIRIPSPSYNLRTISKQDLKKLKEDSRSIFKKCKKNLNGREEEYFTNGNLRTSGNFKKGLAIGVLREFYHNGNVKTISFYNDEGFLEKRIKYKSNGELLIEK